MLDGWTARHGDGEGYEGTFHGRRWEVRYRPRPKGGQHVGSPGPEFRVDGGPWISDGRSRVGTMRDIAQGVYTPELVARLSAPYEP